MNRLAVLALVLVVAACTTGGSVSTARTAAEAPLVMGGTAPVGVGGQVIGPFPLDGVFVYNADPRCAGSSNRLPELGTAICMRSRAIEWLTREVIAGRIQPGPRFNACSYPSDPAWPSCIEQTLRNATPELRWGQSPVWVEGAIEGVPWAGCAAGVTYGPYIRVSFADDTRTQRLVAWETGNAMLLVLDRYTATDGPLTDAAHNYAAAQCGMR